MIRNALYRTLQAGTVLVAGILSLVPARAQVTPATRAITTAVNNADRVALTGSMRRDIARGTDLGAADPSLSARHVALLLARSAARQAALDQYLSDVQNKNSANYHHWLTPAEYGARFGAASEDVETITAWLQSQGLKIERASQAANTIMVSGSVGQMQAAFSTSIHSVLVHGEKHIANISQPRIPRALAPAVKGIVGLDDFHPRSNAVAGPTAKFDKTARKFVPDFTLFDGKGNPYFYVDPADAATIYDTPNASLNTSYKGTSYDGAGITVGVVGDTDVELSPVANYRTAFLGETTGNVNLPTVIVDGADPGTNGDQLEAWLDLEILGGIAPKAKINFYTSGDSDLSAGLFNALERAINDNTVSILSMSFGACEAGLGATTVQYMGELFAQASAQGITVTVSSGDAGAAGCDNDNVETTATRGLAVNGLGSSPYNVSVGGTDYDVLETSFTKYVSTTDSSGNQNSGQPPYYKTALSYIPEEPWNDSTSVNGALGNNQPFMLSSGTTDIIGAGGGRSSMWTKPVFQTSLTPPDGARDVPDVSFLAANGLYGAVWVLCTDEGALYGVDCENSNGVFADSARFSGAGGTSASTPAFAGMLALLEQAIGSRLGNVNNVLYRLAATKYSTVFHDITDGNNAVVCTQGTPDCGANGFTSGYDAVAGYDMASGLGSVDATQMVANWNSATGASSKTTLTIDGSTAAIKATHGTSLNFGVSIDPTSSTGVAALVTTATAAAGEPTLNGQPFTIPISNGSGTGTYNGLPGGQYTVYASYGGDTSTSASQSNAISVDIVAEASSTKLWVNAYAASNQATIANLNAIPYGSYIFSESSVYGTPEGYDASLGYATGTISMLDNGAIIGTAPITSGNFASFPKLTRGVYPYAAGTHTVTATYPGDASYKANTSNAVTFTVVKGTTKPMLYPATPTVTSSSTDNIEVDITTSSLAAPPTGTITLTANGTTLGTTTTLSGGSSVSDGTVVASATFPVQGSQLANGINTLTATYSGDSNYAGSTGTITVTMNGSGFTLKATAINITAGATTGNTATITATSTGSFAGLVNLKCSVTTSPANATSPITCRVPAQLLMTGTSAATATLTVNSTASTTAGSYVVTITGTDAATGKITASTTSAVTVTAQPGIFLSNSGVIALTAGATSGNTAKLTVTPLNGFAGAVALACSVTTSPSGATDPITCAVSPSSVTVSGAAAATSTLTISSTARTTSALLEPSLSSVGGGTALAFGLLFILPLKRSRKLRGLLALNVLSGLVSLGGLMGCGGSGTSSTGGGGTKQTGTTAGAYVVTVTATAPDATTQTTTVNVTVN
ncbi:protease pro-enzyme activation domain-containing protein [Occallatibacter riparius]|uniref:Protease pro-enzyme activation domain-containing protein n=1 Tax=Occallatibacter riparius TaxID=1002689 RepID=A0A9J7BJG0_9BACT|nr:protease pro-enzyme activation domain-containing protein [Occallatibacter riparius]UWZ82815.1 protease pro-enzyme activation domain-containing protein [Occallatibacter riparius]